MDLSRQVERMIAFMDKEGEERSKEMQEKADEEYNIYVGQMVHMERVRINNYYHKLESKAEQIRKVVSSKARNDARLDLLQFRVGLVRGVFDEVQDIIAQEMDDPESGKPILTKLLLQGLMMIMEKRVGIRVREQDIELAEQIIPEVEQEYKSWTTEPLEIVLDKSAYLPKSSLGGVYLSTKRGRVVVENTIESRLLRLMDDVKPLIRVKLFNNMKIAPISKALFESE